MWGTEEWWNLDFVQIEYLKAYKYNSEMFYFLTILAQSMDTWMNTIIFIDLYLSLTNPFQSRERRRRFYQISAFGYCICISWVTNHFWTDTFRKAFTKLNFVILVQQLLLVAAAFTMYTLVKKRLEMKGTSADLRKTII